MLARPGIFRRDEGSVDGHQGFSGLSRTRRRRSPAIPLKLYAELPHQRLRQALGDAAVAVWSAIWIRLGMHVHDLVGSLASAGHLLVEAGTDLERNASSVQSSVVRLPVVGSFLKQRFDGLVDVGVSLRQSGESQLETVNSLSLWLGTLVALLPILVVLWMWGTRRVKWVRDASAAVRLRSDPANQYLFALRAVTNRPISDLRSAGALQAIRSFQDGEYGPLAGLELRKMGLRHADPGK